MSEVLAQLEKKGGGGGELKTATINNVQSTYVTTTLEDSSPRIKRMIIAIENTNKHQLQSVYDFDVNGNTLSLRESLGPSQYNTYVFVSLNGDQLSVKQTYSPNAVVKFQVYYFVE